MVKVGKTFDNRGITSSVNESRMETESFSYLPSIQGVYRGKKLMNPGTASSDVMAS